MAQRRVLPPALSPLPAPQAGPAAHAGDGSGGADFCVEALEEALARQDKPEIFNTDQGCQFTAQYLIPKLAE